MPTGLKRIYGFRDLHFITCSCYRRKPMPGTRHARDALLRILEQVRRKYRFEVVGYVVMPEQFHILIGEPETGTLSTVLQTLKQTIARLLKPRRRRRGKQPTLRPEAELSKYGSHFWQVRFYDFNAYSNAKRIEKLRYTHRNPVTRGLVPSPELWAWSSFRAYFLGGASIVKIEALNPNPTLRKREGGKT